MPTYLVVFVALAEVMSEVSGCIRAQFLGAIQLVRACWLTLTVEGAAKHL